MKYFIIILFTLALIAPIAKVKAQASSTATATVTIVTPLALAIEQKGDTTFNKLPTASISNIENVSLIDKRLSVKNFSERITVADVKISSAEPYTYAITSPVNITLSHSSGSHKMKAATALHKNIKAHSLQNNQDKYQFFVEVNVSKMTKGGLYTAEPFSVIVHHN